MENQRQIMSMLHYGIKHDIGDTEDFVNYIILNIGDEFDFYCQDSELMFLHNGLAFFVVEIGENEIQFSPGESMEVMDENKDAIRDALLLFLVHFKNYSIIQKAEGIIGGQEKFPSVEPIKNMSIGEIEDLYGPLNSERDSTEEDILDPEEESEDSEDFSGWF